MTRPALRIAGRLVVGALLFAGAVACEVPGVLVPTHELLREVYLRGPATRPEVALTFDDGPNGRCTADVLDALAETGAPATFFVLGYNVVRENNAPLVARMVREGHEVGIHGWAHSSNPLFDEGWAGADMKRSCDAVADALRSAGIADPAPTRFYRPPFGFLTVPAVSAATAQGLAIVEWTVSVEDWRDDRTPAQLADVVATQARPGDVIVLHDGNETAQHSVRACTDRAALADAVRLLVPALAVRGLRVARLAEVLAMPQSH